MEPKGLFIDFSKVFNASQELEIGYQVSQLLISFIIVERNNGYTIFDLVSEGVGSIINDNNILHVSVCQYSQILDIYTFFSCNTAFSKEPVSNVLLIGV